MPARLSATSASVTITRTQYERLTSIEREYLLDTLDHDATATAAGIRENVALIRATLLPAAAQKINEQLTRLEALAEQLTIAAQKKWK